MSPETQAALITAISTIIGVVVGASLQSLHTTAEFRRKRSAAIVACAATLLEVRRIYTQQLGPEYLRLLWDSGERIPNFVQPQLDTVIKSLSEYEPFLVANVLWLKQAAANVDQSIASAFDAVDATKIAFRSAYANAWSKPAHMLSKLSSTRTRAS